MRIIYLIGVFLLSAQSVGAQGVIERMADALDDLNREVGALNVRVDELLNKLAGSLPPPPPPPPPSIPTPPPAPPPPPITPPASGTYYIAPSGNDGNPGTIDAPFKTLAKAVPLLKPGETLVVRAGEYETGGLSVNALSIIPSGTSWDKPVSLKAYPGERPVFRRYLPANHPYTENDVRDSIHLPTYDECARFASYGLVKDFPYSCWQGSGNNQPAGGLYFQTPKGFIAGYVIDLLQIWNKVEYVVFDGIDIDAKGITGNPIGFSENSEHIRFQNLEIRYGVASCIAQSVPNELSHKDFDLQFYRVKVHSCGVPFDRNLINGVPARKNKHARYWHGWYLHAGGASFIESESYNHAGTGLGPDGNNIVVRDSYIHDNSAQGLYITGGDNWVIERNVFFNNGGAEIYQHSGKGHTIANNTLIAGPSSDYGVLLGLAAQGSLYRDNLIDGFRRGIYNTECGPSLPCFYTLANTARNNLVRTTVAGNEIGNANGATALIQSGNITGIDPMLDDKLVPRQGSKAIGSATHGGNIGAR